MRETADYALAGKTGVNSSRNNYIQIEYYFF